MSPRELRQTQVTVRLNESERAQLRELEEELAMDAASVLRAGMEALRRGHTAAAPQAAATSEGAGLPIGEGMALLIELSNTANEWRGEVTAKQETILKLLRKIDTTTQRHTDPAAEHDQRMADPVPLDDLVKRLRGQ